MKKWFLHKSESYVNIKYIPLFCDHMNKRSKSEYLYMNIERKIHSFL